MSASDWIGRVRGFAHLVLLVLIGLAAVSAAFGFVPTAAQNVVMTADYLDGPLPLNPEASRWEEVPALAVPLSGQMMIPPNGGGTITSMNVRAFVNSSAISVLVEWADRTQDVQVIRTQDFADAVAIQVVDAGGKAAPYVCMGQADFQTQIWQWRADRDPYAGGGLRLEDIYPNIYADWYPFQNESMFYPSLYAGNILIEQNITPVQVLVAGGAGTIAPAGNATVFGAGIWKDNTWKVVFSRSLQPISPTEVPLRLGARLAVSFAAWDGAAGERDGMKSTSTWADLSVQTPLFDVAPFRPLILAAFVFMGFLLFIGWFRRKKKEPEGPRQPSSYASENLEEMLAPGEKGGTTRRAFLGLLVPGVAGAGLTIASGRAGAIVQKESASEDEEDSAAWQERQKKLMTEFEEGYRKPTHLR